MSHHILAVDDEADFLGTLSLLFQTEGFEVTTALTGDEALQLLAKGLQPHVVLLDLRMPGLSGTDVLARAREMGCTTPALLVSASRDVEEVASRHGFHDWVQKPCSVDELIAKVRDVVDGAK